MDTPADRDVRAQRFKCDQCGAEQEFDPASGKLKCSSCGSTREVPVGSGAIVEYDLVSGLQAAPKGLTLAGTRASKCEDCGANVVFPDGTTATRCTFCGSAKVLEQDENRNAIRPESLLPFAVDKNQANQAFVDWLAKLWFRPRDLRRMARVQEVAGVYVPFWTYDAHVESSWTAEAGYYYYETEVYTTEENGQRVTRTREVQRVRWERAWGNRADDYDDVLVCASKGLPRELAEEMRTFDTHKLVPYAPGFLAGWRAEEYAVDLAQGFALAQQVMDEDQRQRCAGDVPGDTHRHLRVDSAYSGITFKHVLLPVWIAAYRYRDRVYRFLVNGQTGEVVGKAPLSWVKIALLVIAIGALLAVLIVLFGKRQ